jgi:hypothetical protein
MPSVIFVVLPNNDKAYDLVKAWQAIGVPDATLLDSIGVYEASGRSGRDDLPLFPSIRALLAQESPQRTLFTVVGDDVDIERLIAETEKVLGDFEAPNSGILFVIPVTHVRGLRQRR